MAQWADLPGNPYKVLLAMTQRAVDNDVVPRAFLSREELAMAIGFALPPEPPEPDKSAEAKRIRSRRRTVLTAIGDAIAVLKDKGAIRVEKRGQTGQRAEYSFNFQRATEADAAYEARFAGPRKAGTENGKNPALSVGENRALSVGKNPMQSVGINPAPRTTQDNSITTQRNNITQAVSSSTRASHFDDGERPSLEQEQARQSAALRALPSYYDHAEEAA